MKKGLYFILVLFFLFQLVSVNAVENSKLNLISKDSPSSLDTETFSYKNISFSNSRFNFESITNNTGKKLPVSINVLLFDKDKENIGFVTYCSEKDLDSEYAQYNLKPKQSTSFYINISKKYFVEGKSISDISYYSILDDNKYCHIGGYDKYKGKSYDQISKDLSGSTSVDESNTQTNKIIEYFQNSDIKGKITPIIIIVLILIFRGVITNILYKIMYADAPMLSYLPVGTDYVSIKLAFGDLVAKYFVISNIIVLALSFMEFFRAFAYIYAFIGIAGFIIVIISYLINLIIKLSLFVIIFTIFSIIGAWMLGIHILNLIYDINLKKYKLKDITSDDVVVDDVELLDDNTDDKKDDESTKIVDNPEDQMVDISYTETNNSNEFPDFSRSVQGNNNNEQSNNSDGGSDLTNMFR